MKVVVYKNKKEELRLGLIKERTDNGKALILLPSKDGFLDTRTCPLIGDRSKPHTPCTAYELCEGDFCIHSLDPTNARLCRVYSFTDNPFNPILLIALDGRDPELIPVNATTFSSVPIFGYHWRLATINEVADEIPIPSPRLKVRD